MKSLGISALATGFLSGGLFLLVAAFGLGFFFMFLPTLPLFSVGLSKSPRISLYGALVAFLLVATIVELPVGFIYLLVIGLPTYYLSKKALLWRSDGESRQWFPLGLAFLHFACYGIALLALAIFFLSGEEGGLPGLMGTMLQEAFADFDPNYRDAVLAVTQQWVALIVAIMFWLWAMALYVHGWFANRMLTGSNKNIRPDFSFIPFEMPNYALAGVAIFGLFSLMSEPSLQFFGKASLVMLFLPYFFLGAAILHESSKSWPSRGFLLFFTYFMVAAQFWPALIVAGIGIWRHIKRLSMPGASSR